MALPEQQKESNPLLTKRSCLEAGILRFDQLENDVFLMLAVAAMPNSGNKLRSIPFEPFI